ncbi:DUF2806 domain-containing protein [Camelimonas fluminis]|uniref:DUF2806 domain-containing protein n=1 Tax=Camelimonas fluminis TaxID=1576911 RepID=A0ABV7UPN1_9HYPH|nr:DUF2806 domain-containing protein [Camelimonas fluminis]
MADLENEDATPDSGGWIERIIEGGIPQILLGPAGKAISRLIGAGADYPIAHIEGLTQRVRDRNAARSAITRGLSQKALESAVGDPAAVDRALNNFLDRSLRIQANKDAVAAFAIEDLSNDPPAEGSTGPADDWLAKFERLAEDASSEDLRVLFGKLLAGEIRSPRSIAPATLHFASLLDAETTQLIDRVLPFCTGTDAAFHECVTPALTIPEIVRLEQAGFWTTDKALGMKIGDDAMGFFRLRGDDLVALFKGNPGTSATISASLLSPAAMSFVKIVNREFDSEAFGRYLLNKLKCDEVYVGGIQPTPNGGFCMPTYRLVASAQAPT